MQRFTVKTSAKQELVDITDQVQHIVKQHGAVDGICFIFVPHTTAAVTINENADPTVAKDILKGLGSLRLEDMHFNHREGNSPAHIKSSIIGCSECAFIEKGSLVLGTWQGIFLCEFDGPRSRDVMIKIVG